MHFNQGADPSKQSTNQDRVCDEQGLATGSSDGVDGRCRQVGGRHWQLLPTQTARYREVIDLEAALESEEMPKTRKIGVNRLSAFGSSFPKHQRMLEHQHLGSQRLSAQGTPLRNASTTKSLPRATQADPHHPAHPLLGCLSQQKGAEETRLAENGKVGNIASLPVRVSRTVSPHLGRLQECEATAE